MAEKTEKKTNKKPNVFQRLVKYFKDAKGEFKKIVWPSSKQVWNNAAVVLIMVVVFALATWGVDILFSFIRDLILNLF